MELPTCIYIYIVSQKSNTQIQKNTNKIYIAPGILKRIRAQTHGVTRW